MSSPWKQFGGACRQTRPAQPNPSLIRATFRPDADSAFKSLEPNRAYLQPTVCVDGLRDMPSQGCTNNPQCNAGIHAGNSPAHSTSRDPGLVSSRCSVRLIHDIISKFGPEKVELVRSTGFEGLLHLPLLKQNNLRFSTWLMSRVDELSQTLLIAGGTRIHFNKADVARVFGIPASGRSIFHKPDILSVPNSTLVTLDRPINTKHLRSIKIAQGIVARDHEGPMSTTEQDEFKAAFVVFVMSTLLAPCAKHDRVSDDYLHTIEQPGQICSYDWAEYVIRRLLDAVMKLKADIANNVKVPYIYGCSLFLQVLYLDSIDLGVLSMEHNIFPRIRCFTSDRLRSMIAADSSFSANGCVGSRRTKLRPAIGICYHWATSQRSDLGSLNQSGMLALWEASVLMSRILKIPPEAAGPLFVAAADFQRQISSTVGTEALKFMGVLLHIMEPYVDGFSYQSSINAHSPPLDLCSMGHPHVCSYAECCTHFSTIRSKRKSIVCSQIDATINKRQHMINNNDPLNPELPPGSFLDAGDRCVNATDVSIQAVLNRHDIDIRAINAMARFYLTLRPVKATRCTDLNTRPHGDDLAPTAFHTRAGHPLPGPRSPWDLGCRYTIDLVKASDIHKKLSFVEDIDEPWIVHFCPKYIEVLTCAFKSQFLGNSELEMELVDAVIRRYKQVDDELYAHEGPARWRHFVESDFMVSLLAGWFDISDPVLRSHFCGRHICYDVTACQILFFPVLLQYRWVCFAWRMHDNTIVVYDPCISAQACTVALTSYEHVAKLLKSAMMLVSTTISQGWRYDWEDARLEVFHDHTCIPTCPNRTGLLCLHFIQCFNGQQLLPPLDAGHVQDWSASTISGILINAWAPACTNISIRSRDWTSSRTKMLARGSSSAPGIIRRTRHHAPATTSNLSTRTISASSACWDPASMNLKLAAIAA